MNVRRDAAAQPRVVVIGAGVGGLTVAALLAQAGYDVTVLEAGTYPGGSAGTFFHQGYRFDAGATLAGGFQPGGPHALIAARLGLEWPVTPVDPAWVVHLPERRVVLGRARDDVLREFPASGRFWADQAGAADRVWAMAANGLPWPPTGLGELIHLARVGLAHVHSGPGLAPLAVRTVRQWLARYALLDDEAFVRFIDAQLLIAAQTTSSRANALYGATALDLPRQGVYDVAGGMGGLAQTLARAVETLGGRVLYKHHVTRISVENGRAAGVDVRHGRRGESYLPCDFVVANLTPWSLDSLLGDASPARLRREVSRREAGWGAFVLYLGVDASRLPPDLPGHHQIVTDMRGPLGEGRSVFVSLSPAWDQTRAPAGQRAVTVTTHTAIGPWWDLVGRDGDAYEARKAEYSERMLDAIERAIPDFRRAVLLAMPGTPVTYQTWTRRHRGMVGGFPQVSLFRARGPRTGLPNARLVGDSIFPGQSTAGVTLGALRVAADIQRALPRRAPHLISYRRVPGTPQT